MKIREFIEDKFLIDDATTGAFIPFKFRPIQVKYYEMLCKEYAEAQCFSGLREIILKARKEGFTSLVLGMFAALMIWSKKESPRFLEISYKDDATKQHYRRIKNFILSYFQKDPSKWTKKLESGIFKSQSEGSEIVLSHNQSSFYVGTASARTGERGGTVQGILFSESAHYPDTGIISAKEIIEGTRSMVAVGTGLIFQESTANGYNHFKKTWDMAKSNEVDYRARFFPWRDFYTDAEYVTICKGFTDKSLIPQEFPDNEVEAFISSGQCAFSTHKLAKMYEQCSKPLWRGELFDDGSKVNFIDRTQGELALWKKPRTGNKYLVSADPAEGVLHGDFAVAHVIDCSSWEQVAIWRGHIDPGGFGALLCSIGHFFNNAKLLFELNNHGWATRERIRALNYPHVMTRQELFPQFDNVGAKDDPGYPVNLHTKSMYVSAMREAIDSESCIINDLITVQEMQTFIRNKSGNFEAQQGCHDDCVTSLGIGIFALPRIQYQSYRTETRKHNIVPQRFKTGYVGGYV